MNTGRRALPLVAACAAVVAAALLAGVPGAPRRGQAGHPVAVQTATERTRVPAPGAARPPGAAHPASVVVQRFMTAYLAYSYGRPTSLPDASPSLRSQLLADPPVVPAVVRRRRPHVVSLIVVAGARGSDRRALALVADGTTRYPVELEVVDTAEGWRVAGIDPASGP